MGKLEDKLRESAKTGKGLGKDRGVIPVDREAPEGNTVTWDDSGARYASMEPEQKMRASTQSKGGGGMGGADPNAGARPEQASRNIDLARWADAERAKTEAATAAIRPEGATVRDPLDKTPDWLEAYMRNRA